VWEEGGGGGGTAENHDLKDAVRLGMGATQKDPGKKKKKKAFSLCKPSGTV
jgi:hypothetical protein